MMEAVDLLGPHDEVVDHGDVVSPCLCGDTQGQVHVLPARRRIAARMVVDNDDRRGPQFRRAPDDRPDHHRHPRTRAFADLLVPYQAVPGIEMEDPDTLVRDETQIEAQIVDDVGQTGHERPIGYARPEDVSGGGVEAGYALNGLPPPVHGPIETTRRSRQDCAQRTELRKQFVRTTHGVVIAPGGDYPGEVLSRLAVLDRQCRTPTARTATIGQEAHVAIS